MRHLTLTELWKLSYKTTSILAELEEEEETDQKLTTLSEKINSEANESAEAVGEVEQTSKSEAGEQHNFSGWKQFMLSAASESNG